MLTLFRYNWQVRAEWFNWCEGVQEDELIRPRIGGVGTFLRTLWHVVDAKWSWIRALSHTCLCEIPPILEQWTLARDLTEVHASWRPGETFSAGHVFPHVIAHEIHYMGQLSIWARELGREPVSANLVDRSLE